MFLYGKYFNTGPLCFREISIARITLSESMSEMTVYTYSKDACACWIKSMFSFTYGFRDYCINMRHNMSFCLNLCESLHKFAKKHL